MPVLTANDFSQQMIAQVRVLDPNISCEIGTPERKLIDTVAQTLADNQIDLTGLQGALDIDAKFGTNLDQFTNLFSMQRQQAIAATGFVTFSRPTAAITQIVIPQNVVLQSVANNTVVQFVTTASGIIAAGQATSEAIPIQAVVTGVVGNVAANTITSMVGSLVPGVTAVTNPNALTNGIDLEDDNTFKVRFKNTWARNLAGVEDQYLALALSGTYTTKAIAIGLQSTYLEYMQVPSYDDAGYLNNVLTSGQNTGGSQGNWTTALSTIPYAKQVYTDTQTFVGDGEQGNVQYFYTPKIDYIFNYPPVYAGDTQRENTSGLTAVQNLHPNFTFINVYNPPGAPTIPGGLQALTPQDVVLTEFRYLSSASRNDLTHNIDNCVDIYVDGHNDVQTSVMVLPNISGASFNTSVNSPWYYENYRRDGNVTKRPQLGNYITPLFQSPIDALPASIIIGGTSFSLGADYWLVHEYDALQGSIRARDGVEWNANTAGTALLTAQSNSTPLSINNYSYDANITVVQNLMESNRQINTDVLVHQARQRYFKLDITLMYNASANSTVVNSAIAATLQAYYSRQYYGTVVRLSDLLEIIHEVAGVANVRWTYGVPSVTEVDINGNPLHGVAVDRLAYGSVNPTTPEVQTLYVVGNPSGSFVLSWPSVMTTAAIPFSGLTATVIQNAIRAVQPTSGVYNNVTVTQDNRPTIGATAPISSYTITYGNYATTIASGSNGVSLPQSTVNVASTSGFASSGQILVGGSPVNYTGKTSGSFTGCTGGSGTMTTGEAVIQYGAAVVPTVTNTVSSSDYTYTSDFFLLDNELPAAPTGQLATDTLPGVIIRPRAQNTFTRPGL